MLFNALFWGFMLAVQPVRSDAASLLVYLSVELASAREPQGVTRWAVIAQMTAKKATLWAVLAPAIFYLVGRLPFFSRT